MVDALPSGLSRGTRLVVPQVEESARGDCESLANPNLIYPCLSPMRVPLERPLGNASTIANLVVPI